jgi:hypothetical protein
VRPTVAFVLAAAARVAAAQDPVSGGSGTLYMSARPGRILIVEEATFRVTGEIPLPRAQPGISYPLQLSRDKKRFLSFAPSMEDLEIVDIAARRVVDTVRLSEGNKRVRLMAYEGSGEHARFLALAVRPATKLVDRFEIGPKSLVEYDLEKRKLGRTIPWPRGEEREAVGLAYSPDGKLLYVFADDVFVYDTARLEVVDRWELSRPVEDGFGRLRLDALGGSLADVNEEPGFLTGLFEVDDPLQHRKMMGVARVDLPAKKVDFWTVGPAKEVRQLALAPGRQKAYAVLDEVGSWELWTFDLQARRLEKRTSIAGRPRMSLAVSTNAKLLYVHGAGNTIDLYDAASHRFLRTVTMDAEVGQVFVFPPAP